MTTTSFRARVSRLEQQSVPGRSTSTNVELDRAIATIRDAANAQEALARFDRVRTMLLLQGCRSVGRSDVTADEALSRFADFRNSVEATQLHQQSRGAVGLKSEPRL
jgi:hypothetical protein